MRRLERSRHVTWPIKVIMCISNLLVTLVLLASILQNYNKFEKLFGGTLSQTKQIELVKRTVVNGILALVLILKTFGKVQSMHILDHLIGLSLFALFAATFNTDTQS